MMYRMKIPLINIRNKIEVETTDYNASDIDLFATKDEIDNANSSLIKAI